MNNNLKIFLKAIHKVGYPNPSVQSIANVVGYNLENFLPDLKNELGQDGVDKFCKNAIEKLSGGKGIKLNFGADEYVVAEIEVIGYDEDESDQDVIVNLQYIDSKILFMNEDGFDEYVKIEDILDSVDFGDWGDYDEMMDHIKEGLYNVIYMNCGFGIWVQ